MAKKLRLVISDIAQADLNSIATYIASDSPMRAISFVRELRARALKIPDQPLAAPLATEFGEGIRKVVMGKYLILYAVEADMIVIHSFYHSARLPRTVKNRAF